MALPEKLFELRRKAGLSQEQLAEKLDVSRQAVSKWESGKAIPESETLIAICKLFDISLDSLVMGREEPEKQEKSADANAASAESATAPQKSGDNRKWLVGLCVVLCGVLCLFVWGIVTLLKPETTEQMAASSAITLDGNGIFLFFCAAAIIVGAVILLKNVSKR